MSAKSKPRQKVYIREPGLSARAVFVIDTDDKIVHAEYVPEVTSEPNYAAAFGAVKAAHEQLGSRVEARSDRVGTMRDPNVAWLEARRSGLPHMTEVRRLVVRTS